MDDELDLLDPDYFCDTDVHNITFDQEAEKYLLAHMLSDSRPVGKGRRRSSGHVMWFGTGEQSLKTMQQERNMIMAKRKKKGETVESKDNKGFTVALNVRKYLDEKSSPLLYVLCDGRVHISWVIDGRILCVEHIPENWPATCLAVFDDYKDWRKATADTDWIAEARQQVKVGRTVWDFDGDIRVLD